MIKSVIKVFSISISFLFQINAILNRIEKNKSGFPKMIKQNSCF